jgi:hypothetical protein
MRVAYRNFIALFALVALTACASWGIPAPETFNAKAAAAYTSVTGARQTTLSLLQAGHISAEDAENVNSQADNLRQAIDIALQIYPTEPGEATDKLEVTIRALQILTAYLEQRR